MFSTLTPTRKMAPSVSRLDERVSCVTVSQVFWFAVLDSSVVEKLPVTEADTLADVDTPAVPISALFSTPSVTDTPPVYDRLSVFVVEPPFELETEFSLPVESV